MMSQMPGLDAGLQMEQPVPWDARLLPQGEDVWSIVELVTLAGEGSFAPIVSDRLTEVPFASRANAWQREQLDLLVALFRADVPMAEIADRLGRSLWSVRSKVWSLGYRRASKVPWSLREDREIARRYPFDPTDELASDLGRTPDAVRKRAEILGVSAHSRHEWAAPEIEQLIAEFREGLSLSWIATSLPKPIGAVRKQLAKLGLYRDFPAPWTEAEEEELRQRYGVDRTTDIARDLGRGVPATYSKASALGLSKPPKPEWTDDEVAKLIDLFRADLPLAEIVLDLGRPYHGVRSKISDLGLRRNTALPWTGEEDAELRRRYGTEATAGVAQDLGRSAAAVYARAQSLGLTRTMDPDWSGWELAQLDVGYPSGVPVPALARMIGRSVSATLTKAHDRGLRHGLARDRWAPDEDRELNDGVAHDQTAREISERLSRLGFDRSRAAVKIRLRALGFDRTSSAPYLPEEDDRIRRGYAASESREAIGASIGRSASGISRRAKLIGVRHQSPNGGRKGEAWTEEQHARLRAGYAVGEKPQAIADATGKTVRAVYTEANRLGLTGVLRKPYTDEEDAILLSVGRGSGGPTLKEAAQITGRNLQAIFKRRQKLLAALTATQQERVDG